MIEQFTALELGQKVNNKEIKPTEVIEDFVKRYDKINPKVNAFTYINIDDAMKQARKLEDRLAKNATDIGLLAGVPVGLKDFLPSKKGWSNSHGGVRSLIAVDEYDSEFTKAAEACDAIVVGKTNAPAFGFRGLTDNALYGPTSTPFKIGYNSGGSSGGAASAVASGIISMCEGGDAGGSLRIPAAWCNCFAFKASAGIIPSVCRPDAWTATHPYCCTGAETKSVADAAIMYTMMEKFDPRDPLSVKAHKTSRLFYLNKDVSDMKVAMTFNFDLFPDPDAEIAKAMVNMALVMQEAYPGLKIDVHPHFKFNYSLKEYEDAWLRGISIDTAVDLELMRQHGFDLQGEHADELPPEFIEWNKKALASTMLDYRQFHEIRTDILDAHQDIFDDYDLILAPVTGCMPPKNRTQRGELTYGPSELNGVKVDPLIGFCYTYLENMIGTPVASIPIGISKEGFPIGMQIIAPRYYDRDVFRFAFALEQAMPWRHLYPDLA